MYHASCVLVSPYHETQAYNFDAHLMNNEVDCRALAEVQNVTEYMIQFIAICSIRFMELEHINCQSQN